MNSNSNTLNNPASSLMDIGSNRLVSRSVSWNASGAYLGYGASDRMARIVALDTASSNHREILTIAGHQQPVTKVRFHPKEETTLLTAANDNSIRLWDCRQGSQKSLGSFEAKTTVDVSWCPTMGQYMVVTERSGRVCVYDRRQLSPRGGAMASSSATPAPRVAPVHSSHRPPFLADAAIFSPHGGDYIIASLTEQGEGMSDLGVWRWKTTNNTDMDLTKDEDSPIMRFPAHAGPIYTMALSQDGKRLVTGGADAMVGFWDTDSMVCTHSFAMPTKLIRSVAVSPKGWVAVSNEENDVFVASASTGECFGQVVISMDRGGAEEIVWHPRGFPLLACARVPLDHPHKPASPVVVAKVNITSNR